MSKSIIASINNGNSFFPYSQSTQITLKNYSNKGNKPESPQTHSFIPEKTTIANLQELFIEEVDFCFEGESFCFGLERGVKKVKFLFLSPSYTLTRKDTNKTLFVFRKYEETSRTQTVIVRRYFEASESRLESIIFPLNVTNGHVFYFLERTYEDPHIFEKLIFLSNRTAGLESRLHKLSFRPFPYVDTIFIFNKILPHNSIASKHIPALPSPPEPTQNQVTIHYYFEPFEHNKEITLTPKNLDSIVWRSEILPTDTSVAEVLKRFKNNVWLNQFLNHYGAVVYENNLMTLSDLSAPHNFLLKQKHDILLFANNLCWNCLKTPANTGTFFLCKKCKLVCSFKGCQRTRQFSCMECSEVFCRQHSNFCTSSTCQKSACSICVKQPELLLCNHSFKRDTTGYNVDYQLWHFSDTTKFLNAGQLKNVEYLNQIPTLPQFQNYDYIILNNENQRDNKFYFTKGSKIFASSLKELISSESSDLKLRIELKLGKHFCECLEEQRTGNKGEIICQDCGLEIFPKLPVCSLGKEATFNLFIPSLTSPIYSGSVSFKTSLTDLISSLSRVLDRRFDCLNNVHSFTIKQNGTKKHICYNSHQDLQPLFAKSKKIEKQHAKIYVDSVYSCKCTSGSYNLNPSTALKSLCTKCKKSYFLFHNQEDTSLCPTCVDQQPDTLVGEHLLRLSKLLFITPDQHFANYLSQANKSVNSDRNIKRRKINHPIYDRPSFVLKLERKLGEATNLIHQGQKLFFKCHLCSVNLNTTHSQCSKYPKCSKCKFSYCEKCFNATNTPTPQECLFCQQDLTISQNDFSNNSNKVVTKIKQIERFCSKAELFSREMNLFLSAEI